LGVPGLSAATSDSRLVKSTGAFDWNADAIRLVAEAGSDLISRHGPDGRYAYVNAAVERLIGFSPADVLDTHPLAFVHPEDVTRVRRNMLSLVRRHNSRRFKFRVRCSDDSYLWVETNCQVLRDGQSGRPLEFVAITRDVSAQERQADAVRIQAERLSIAVAGTGTGVWEWDVATDAVYWTPSMYRLCLASSDLALGQKGVIQQFLHPDDLDDSLDALQNIRVGETSEFQLEHRITRSDGSIIWVDSRAQAVLDTGGKVRRVIGLVNDITAQKRAEERAQLAELRLLDGINSINEGFALWDADDRLVLSNEKYVDLYPVVRPLMRPGVRFQDICRLVVESGNVRVDRPVEDFITRRIEDHRRANCVTEQQLADGRWVLISEWKTAEGGVVGSWTDITALKNQEAELADLAAKYALEKERAEAASFSKSQFLANMSHELRTPLNAILGFAELMSSEFLGPLGHERYKGYALDIRESGKHLLDLINDLLDMSRIEAGKLVLQRRSVDIVEETKNCFRVLEVRAQEAGIRLEHEALETVGPAYADRRAVRQILLNLLTNGLKFTDAEGTVRVRVTDDGVNLKIDVTDTGCGIAARDVARILEPFEQVEASQVRSREGSGLGLALTKSLVELHEGCLLIDSVPREGTTVTFTLPRADVQMTMFD